MKNIVIAGVAFFILWSCKSPKSQPVLVSHKDTVEHTSLFAPLSEQEKQHYHNAVANALDHSLLRSRFNGGILVAKNGTVVYEKYFGFRDLKAKDSINAETPFQIASTSKTLTAAAILKLAEEGRLSLNDTITKFFPAFPYKDITIKLLLSHRSGLPNYLYYLEKSPWNRHQLASNTDILNTLINWHPAQAYRPNTHFHYCNTNYVLLALIIEKVSGQSYPEYMKQNFFDPLGMSHTFVHTMTDSTKMLTQSYQRNGAVWTPDYSDGPYGDKNIFSTPEDLLKWDKALYDGKIISPKMLDSAFTPYSNERPGRRNYGYGWRMIKLPNGKKIIYHNGHWHGFNSAFARLTDEKATIIILSNRFNQNVYISAKKLYNLFGDYDGRHEESGEE